MDAVKNTGVYNSTYRARIDGKDRWLSVRAEFERDDDGRAVRAFGVTQDITDRKRAEYEVRRLNASLEQRIQERTRDLKAAYDELESYSYAVAHTEVDTFSRNVVCASICLRMDSTDAVDRRKRLVSALSSRRSPNTKCSVSIHGLPNWLAS
jgi:hypothetical protein